ncbi:MAG: hypothetical protein JXB40_01745 [Candidatus Omnitrophica bacterium]|nr:hypothetical protein [Candidatus Omnitrophota bacterium]
MFTIRKLSKREGIITCVVALVIVAAVTYSMIVEPLAQRWHSLDNQIKKKAFDLMKDTKLLSRKVSESDYAKFSAYAGAKKKEEEDVSDALTLIESVCRENSCKIVSIRPGSAKTSGRIKEMMIDMDIEAPIESLAKFFYDIETTPVMALKIDKFTINSTMDSRGTVKCALSMDRMLAAARD